MKLATNPSPVEISGALEKSQFHISASKEAFRILSSGLYNNKIRAIIRELSCNAWDAHVAAGKKDVPFEVHLPTSFEPTFSIKDYGTGLSHEAILSLYTTYFGTDKSNSNEFIGALGLGSKSPFCYTEGFSVTSRYQGKTRIYSAYIDEQGVPNILLQSEEETPEEPDGLEVQFPVNVKDCWEFENQASEVFEFFEPLPKINIPITVSKKEYVFKTDTWGLRKEASYGNTDPRAIQGLVAYGLGSIDESKKSPIQDKLIELPLDIFFDIGELSVTASRETLSNDERTINNILKSLDKIYLTLIDEVKKQLDNCSSQWEARLLLFNLTSTDGLGTLVHQALSEGKFDGTYKKFNLKNQDAYINEFDYPNIKIAKFTKKNWGSPLAEKVIESRDEKRLAAKATLKEAAYLYFTSKSNVAFAINDLGFGVEKYLHYYLQESADSKSTSIVYLISRATKVTPNTKVITEGKKIIDEIGNPPVMLLSDLKAKYHDAVSTKKPSTPSPKREYIYFNTYASVYRHRNSGTIQGWSKGWNKAETPEASITKYYVVVDNLVPKYFTYADDFQKFVLAVQQSKKFSFGKDDLVYGLTKTSPHIGQSDWVEFFGSTIDELKKKMTVTEEEKLSLHLKKFSIGHRLSGILEDIGKNSPLDPTSPIQQFCKRLVDIQKYSKQGYEHLAEVVAFAVKNGFYTTTNLIDFSEEFKQVIKRYPLLDVAGDAYYYGAISIKQALIEYFKLIDLNHILTTGEQQNVSLIVN
jgi:hypothetical protein